MLTNFLKGRMRENTRIDAEGAGYIVGAVADS
jgi:hypothetical protein